MKRKLIILASVLLPVVLALGWLGYSDTGLRWAYARLATGLPGELRIGSLEGGLLGPITLQDIDYADADTRITARRLVLRWRPTRLVLQGALHIDALEIDTLSVETEAEDSTEVADEVFLSLPAIDLPIDLRVDRFAVDGFAFHHPAGVHHLDHLEVSGDLDAHGVDIESARLAAARGELSLHGRLRPEDAYSHDLGLEWRLQPPTGEELRGSGRLQGDLRQTRLQQQVEGAASFDLDFAVEDLEKRPAWRARLLLTDFDTARLAEGLVPLSGSAKISATGDLQSLGASGDLRLQSQLPRPLAASFELGRMSTTLDYRALVFEHLHLRTDGGELRANGRVDLAETVSWDLRLGLENFDPAKLFPEWPGEIAATIETRGDLLEGGPDAHFRIGGLRGTLRGYPVALDGGLRWQGDAIELQRIDLTSGSSRVAVSGSIDRRVELEWSLDSPDLGQLFPRASGRLQARGQLSGAREAPGITAEFSGERLQVGAYAAERLAGRLRLAQVHEWQIGYLASNLEIRADADAVLLDDTRFERVEVDASDGDIALRANSGASRLQLRLDGTVSNSGWSGHLATVRVIHPDIGDWRLARPAALELSAAKMLLQDACITESVQGKLCISAAGGNGDWRVDGELREVPLTRLQPWLPPDLELAGVADADAHLRLAAGDRLLGELGLRFSPGVMRYQPRTGQSELVSYRGGNIDVEFGESGIRARAALGLRPREFVDIELALPGASLLSLDSATQELSLDARVALADIGIAESLFADVSDLRGGLEIEAQVAGSVARPRVRGSARLVDAGFNLPQLHLRVDQLHGEARSDGLESTDYRFTARIAGGDVELEGSTRLAADAGWPSRLRLRSTGAALAPLLREHLPAGMQVAGDLDVDAGLELALPDRLTGDLLLGVSNASLAYPLLDDTLERWAVSDTEVRIRLDSDGVRADTDLRIGENRVQGTVTLPGAQILVIEPARQALRGDVDFEFRDLSLLATLLPEMQQPRGTLDGGVDLGGTLAAPELSVDARLRDATLQAPRLGIEIVALEAEARTDAPGQLQFSARGESGDGYLVIDGSSRLDAASGWPTELRIRGDNFTIANIPEAAVSASPDLTVRIDDYNIDIRGEVLLPSARLQPRDLSSARRVSADAVVIGGEQPQQRRWQINSSVRLVLGDRVSFYGYGFDGRIAGYLTIEERTGQPTSGRGVIDVVEGRYRAYGQQLDILDGRLLFAGGPLSNPGVDVRAVRDTGDVIAGVSVSGLLRQPQVELFSDPAMGQTDTLSYLLTGGPLETATSEQGAMMANAAVALGLTGGDSMARSLAARFGFEDMRVESGSNGEQASLIMGRYLSSDLYVSYGIGLIESLNTLNLRYRLSRRWRIEAESGQEHGADLLYTIER
ncbi:MAG: translocation/assembly module TamB domain-containing protein [Gammaproteobacteria bacterium]|nr:translocation/assembly module TamB domain-containing protein [Gammaproteobacteria bacterium]